MFCAGCGTTLPPSAYFCPTCGTQVSVGHTDPPTLVDAPVSPALASSGTGVAGPPTPPQAPGLLARSAPTRAQVASDAAALGVTLVAALGVGFLAVMLLAVTSLPSEARGTVAEWTTVSVLLIGMAHGAGVGASVDLGPYGGAEMVVSVAPLTLTALLAVGMYVALRRSESAHPSHGWANALTRCVVGAGAYSAALTLVAILLRGNVVAPLVLGIEATMSVGVRAGSLLALAFLLALVVGAPAHRVAGAPDAPSWLRSETQAARAVLSALGAVGGAAALLALLGGGWWLWQEGAGRSGIAPPISAAEPPPGSGAAVLALVGVLLNALGHAAGFAAGIGETYRLAALDAFSQAGTVNLLTTDGAPALLRFLPGVVWLVALLVGVRCGARCDPRDAPLRTVLRYAVIGPVVVLVLLLATSGSVRASGEASVFGSPVRGTMAAVAQLDVGTGLLVALLLSGLMAVGHLVLLPLLAGAYPARMTSILGRRMAPVWGLRLAHAQVTRGRQPPAWQVAMADSAAHERVRPLPDCRALMNRTLLIVALLMLLALVVTIGSTVLQRTYGPKAVASRYVTAVARGTADEAQRLLTRRPVSPLLSEDVLRRARTGAPLTAISIGEVTTAGDTATVLVDYSLDGPRTAILTLDRMHAGVLGLNPDWRVAAGGLGSIRAPGASVYGVPLQPPGEDVAAFPGLYDVTWPGDALHQEAKGTAVVGLGEDVPLSPERSLRADAAQVVGRAVTASLRSCLAQKVLKPTGCPFERWETADVSNVRWSLAGDIDSGVVDEAEGEVAFSGLLPLKVHYLRAATWLSPAEIVDDTVNAPIAGTASVDPATDTVTVTLVQ